MYFVLCGPVPGNPWTVSLPGGLGVGDPQTRQFLKKCKMLRKKQVLDFEAQDNFFLFLKLSCDNNQH